jgi:hypothetical protein
MRTLLARADSVVRGELIISEGDSLKRMLTQLLGLILLFGCTYGAVMGTFGGIFGDRILQVIYSAIKVPILLLVTFALSLPSFFILNMLYGLGTDFPQALRALLASQAGLTVLLASFAPFTLLWNASASGHQATVLFNALLFGIATCGGQVLLRRYYRALLERDNRHRMLLRFWGILYAFVGIQMGWVLRPFIGDADKPVAFFREDSWGNAYVVIFQLLRHVFL